MKPIFVTGGIKSSGALSLSSSSRLGSACSRGSSNSPKRKGRNAYTLLKARLPSGSVALPPLSVSPMPRQVQGRKETLSLGGRRRNIRQSGLCIWG